MGGDEPMHINDARTRPRGTPEGEPQVGGRGEEMEEDKLSDNRTFRQNRHLRTNLEAKEGTSDMDTYRNHSSRYT